MRSKHFDIKTVQIINTNKLNADRKTFIDIPAPMKCYLYIYIWSIEESAYIINLILENEIKKLQKFTIVFIYLFINPYWTPLLSVQQPILIQFTTETFAPSIKMTCVASKSNLIKMIPFTFEAELAAHCTFSKIIETGTSAYYNYYFLMYIQLKLSAMNIQYG